jgi:hypothetical protein
MRVISYGDPSIVNHVNHEAVPLPCFTSEQIAEFKPVLRFLNKKDLDILYLIFIAKKKQMAVQRILNRTQSSICYDIKRIRMRVRFVIYLLSVCDCLISFLRSERSKAYTPYELDVLASMFYSTSLTQTARVLKHSQIKIRYTFEALINKLAENGDWDMYEIFTMIRRNFNIVKRVYKPDTN